MESTCFVTPAVASRAAIPVSDEVRTWVRPLRRTLAPIFAPAQGTRMPSAGSLAGPSVAGIDAHIRERNVVSYLPTIETQQTKGAGFGVTIPVRTWSPPD